MSKGSTKDCRRRCMTTERGFAGAVEAAEPQGDNGDSVNHPKHYNSSLAKCLGCGRPIECIDVVEHFPFNLGNTIKYVWRSGFKGVVLEDLKKGRWYLDRAIQQLERSGAK